MFDLLLEMQSPLLICAKGDKNRPVAGGNLFASWRTPVHFFLEKLNFFSIRVKITPKFLFFIFFVILFIRFITKKFQNIIYGLLLKVEYRRNYKILKQV